MNLSCKQDPFCFIVPIAVGISMWRILKAIGAVEGKGLACEIIDEQYVESLSMHVSLACMFCRYGAPHYLLLLSV